MLLTRNLHIYNLYYFHNNTCDPYEETQGQVQIWVTLTYFLRSQRLIKEKVCHRDISTPKIYITSILIPVIHMRKLKVKFKYG